MDSNGREFNRNRLIALMSAIVLEEVFVYQLSEGLLSLIRKSGHNTLFIQFRLAVYLCSVFLLPSILEQLLLQIV